MCVCFIVLTKMALHTLLSLCDSSLHDLVEDVSCHPCAITLGELHLMGQNSTRTLAALESYTVMGCLLLSLWLASLFSLPLVQSTMTHIYGEQLHERSSNRRIT
jgi:hypothetical protein